VAKVQRLALEYADLDLTDPFVLVPLSGMIMSVPWYGYTRVRLAKQTVLVRNRLRKLGIPELRAEQFRHRLEIDKMQKLGSGHHSPVYKCWYTQEGAERAVTVKGTGWTASDMLEDFEREVEILHASQGHSAVVRLIGTHFDNKQLGYGLVYEFAPGDTLKSLTRPADDSSGSEYLPMSLGCQFAVLEQIVDVMAYMHSKGIMYRDLKSLNVIIDHPTRESELKVHLIDFGSATRFGHATKALPPVRRTGLGQLYRSMFRKIRDKKKEQRSRTAEVGTYDWMAPEVWTQKYTEKCDIYSFAMVLYEMVAWKDPWAGTPKEALPVMLTRDMRPDMPREMAFTFAELIHRCWRTAPEERPSFEDLRAELKEAKSLFKRFDIDGDGEVSLEELRRKWAWEGRNDEQMQAEIFAEFDKNHSGGLDRDEFSAMIAKYKERHKEKHKDNPSGASSA